MSASIATKQFEQLVQKIMPNGSLLQAWTLTGGASAQMTALEVEQPDGSTQKLVVRRFSNRYHLQRVVNEFKLLQITQSAGVATPTPYYVGHPGDIFATPYLVLEYIEGAPDFTPTNAIDRVAQMADQLARIHAIADAALKTLTLPNLANSLISQFGGPAAIRATSAAEGRARAALAAAWPLPQPNHSVLLHGDFWPGNILWQNGRLAAVIDWEDAATGDPLTDLAISRFDILFIYDVAAMDVFTRRYQALAAVDFTQLPYWDLLAALRAAPAIAEWAGGWPALGREDLTEAAIREKHNWFIEQALKIRD